MNNSDDATAEAVRRARCDEQLKEGAGNIKFGVGVGVFGATSLAILGATCPLCFFVAPAMVAVGAHKRHKAKRDLEGLGETPDLTINWGDKADLA